MTELTLWLKTKSSFRQTVSLQKQQKELQKNFQKKYSQELSETTQKYSKQLYQESKLKKTVKNERACYEVVHSLQFIEIWESFALYNSECRLK